MGQKSSPVGLRLQINRTWDSRWFAEGQDYGRLLLEDLKIRKHILATLPQAAPQLLSYTLYRWENNIRAATVLRGHRFVGWRHGRAPRCGRPG